MEQCLYFGGEQHQGIDVGAVIMDIYHVVG